MPSRAKEKGAALLDKLHRILKGWIKGKILGFFFIAVLTGTVDHPDAARADTGPCGRPAKFHPKLCPDYRAGAGFFARAATGKLDSFIVIGMCTAIQVVQSAVTQPLIQKKMVSMPPALLVFGQVAMGMLGGFWGAMLATPLMAIIMTVVNELYVEQQSTQKNK